MRGGKITRDLFIARFDSLDDLQIRTDDQPDWKAALSLAERHSLSFYDALYLELATRRRLPIATFDKAIVRGAIAEQVPLICKH